jgi:hypothetical protein
MRDGQPRRVDDIAAVQDQVEVERPRRVRVRALAPETLLDVEQPRKQRVRVERRRADPRSIEKWRLVAAPADRDGVVKGRQPQIRDESAERVGRIVKAALPVSEVAAQGNGDRCGQAGVEASLFYSSQRVERTAPCRATPPVRRPRRSSNPDAA